MTYTPPTQDMMFVLEHVVGLDKLPEHEALGKLDADAVASILEPASDLAANVLAPLNYPGDRARLALKDGVLETAPGFKEAYRQYCEGGWNSVVFDPAHGGQGLPWLVAFAVNEMWQGANMSFGLCPLLNQGAIEAIEAHASDELKAEYLEKMISGEWTGTMNLTEPQAGSDLAAVKTKAVPAGDGTYKISGQKIFITYGEHDFTDNIIHLVLARLPDAPEGVKGISLFIVPKFLKDGTRNDLICTGIEHKLGIHASPTCTMQFGDKGGATGYLVGTANEGLKYMFTMMNNARLSVGLQGVAIAEAAYQKALGYAKERVQGAPLNKKGSGGVTISEHADVKRMLLSMVSQIEAGRAMTYEAALSLDLARAGDAAAQARVDLMTPLVKSWCTDMACEVASTGVQIHGGMGFIEETGAAQFYRDARILPIYEGTNGIQSADLAFRKILRDGGAALKTYLAEFEGVLGALKEAKGDDFEAIAQELADAYKQVSKAALQIGALSKDDLDYVAAVSVPFLKALAGAAAGMMLARSALAAQALLSEGGSDADFLSRKILIARFYAETFLPQAGAHARNVLSTAKTVVSSRF
ncbi:MAG: acyl-CoA dehydrogenase [Micavibrio aeruginosavorus]|uniref:3-methylmercaptopropionyl-CoA dehydrogenase n=1 Tax=Micavibrio aeruginosavorus TaxID=349221 RepID=A0A2W5PV68_9BACT|nr:MAG: acyl-CoA dehydrogenase [Micavibrio aeruginosavorus]